MRQVLESPELLTRICEIIHKEEKFARVGSSLPSAARVNSWWRDIVCRLLWAGPPVNALVRVRRSRRQIYASYIKTLALDFELDPTLNTLFRGLQFPRLQKLDLANRLTYTTRRNGNLGSDDGWNTTVSQYLGPALESLTLHWCNAVCTPIFLTDLAARSSRLKSIAFINVGSQLQADDLLKFFEVCDQLENVQLNLSPPLVTSDILLCLPRMRKLEAFECGSPMDRMEYLKTIKDQNSAPFPSLETISLYVSLDLVHYAPLQSEKPPSLPALSYLLSFTLSQGKLSPS
jgi:hypothetical protein